MILLALESSAKTCSAAIWKDGAIAAEISINNTLTHSQTLMPIIEEVIGYSGIAVGDINVFACVNGPGSFTGIRIGVATTKALAHGAGKKCIAINTLDALANNLANRGLIVPMMDARCGQVYTAIFDRGEKLRRIGGYEATAVEPLLDGLALLGTEVAFVGDGALAFQERLRDKLGARAVLAPPHLINGRAASVAQLAAEKYEKNELLSYDELMPFYLRQPQAERQFSDKA